jgi:hypothetical protein
VPRALSRESGVELGLGDLAELALLAHPGAGPQHVDRALFLPDRVVQAVKVGQVGRVALHGGHVPADQLDSFLQRFLPPTLDEDVSSFVNEHLGAGQRHAG